MYDFMLNSVCFSAKDITIMSDKLDYYRLIKKPKYCGDFMHQLFEWNTLKEFDDKHIE